MFVTKTILNYLIFLETVSSVGDSGVALRFSAAGGKVSPCARNCCTRQSSARSRLAESLGLVCNTENMHVVMDTIMNI